MGGVFIPAKTIEACSLAMVRVRWPSLAQHASRGRGSGPNQLEEMLTTASNQYAHVKAFGACFISDVHASKRLASRLSPSHQLCRMAGAATAGGGTWDRASPVLAVGGARAQGCGTASVESW